MNSLRVLRRLHDAIDPVIPNRLERQFLNLYLASQQVRYRGDAVYCPLCESSFDRWIAGVDGDSTCPRCICSPRHRMLWLFLTNEAGIDPGTRVLHVGPNFGMRRTLSRAVTDYCSVDIDSPLADEHLDVTDLPDRFGPFDLIVCSHVLEHVDADRQAMREFHTVLAPDGIALLQVPVSRERATTYTDPTVTTPEERERVYGHDDHRRIYGRDYPDRLREAGFTVDVRDYVSSLPRERRARFGLPDERPIYVCRN